jgi:hypothetical protein
MLERAVGKVHLARDARASVADTTTPVVDHSTRWHFLIP